MADSPKTPVQVGSKEYIALPDFGFDTIPARIDTGAQKSSIWASNIRIDGGKLVFNLFAPGSTYYREAPIVSDKYRSTIVRNSFGHQEFRYVTRLRVRLGGHTLTRWFTLADRSNNTYPVLLGRNFLQGKFVVNVSDTFVHAKGEQFKVCILTGDVPATDEFFRQVKLLNKRPVDYVAASYQSLAFYVHGTDTRVTNMDDDDADLASYALTYFKCRHHLEIAQAAAEYLHFKGKGVIDEEFLTGVSSDKLSEYMKLACHGIAVPPTIYMSVPVLRQKFAAVAERLGTPFVLKEAMSNKGNNNYLVDTQDDFERILNDSPEESLWLAQKYMQNDGFYRVYAFGKYVTLAIWRSTTPHENRLKRHLNKPRGGVNARNVLLRNVPSEVQDLALQAAACMNRQIAGVDLLQDNQTGKWYILEANSGPQIRTGSFVDDKAKAVAEFFDRKLG